MAFVVPMGSCFFFVPNCPLWLVLCALWVPFCALVFFLVQVGCIILTKCALWCKWHLQSGRFVQQSVPKWPRWDHNVGSGDIWLPPVKPPDNRDLTGGTKFRQIGDFGAILSPTLPKVVPTWYQIVTLSAPDGTQKG